MKPDLSTRLAQARVVKLMQAGEWAQAEKLARGLLARQARDAQSIYKLASVLSQQERHNAHTTAADALMMGLPVVTLMGDAFPVRVAGSLLHAIGLPELITHSLDDYEALALKLLRDPAQLSALKVKLAGNRATHPLFNTERFCLQLEDVYRDMRPAAVSAASLSNAKV